MNHEQLRVSWKPYEPLVPFATAETRLRRPESLAREPITLILPSIELGPDGPVMKSVFAFTEHFLCEVRLSDGSTDEFDFVLRRMMFNLRVHLSERAVKRADETEASFQLATVTVKHTGVFGSEFKYAGTDREPWLSAVLEVFPLKLLLENKAPSGDGIVMVGQPQGVPSIKR